MINDIPDDSENDVIEGAKVISALGVEQVKCHSLYILKGTALGVSYERNEFRPLTMEEFIERTIKFLEYLTQR